MYLTVLSPKVVACQVECIGPSAVELTLPLNAAKRPKLSFATVVGDQVVFQDSIQLPAVHSMPLLGGMPSSCPWLLLIKAASFEGNQRIIHDIVNIIPLYHMSMYDNIL